MGKNKDVGLIMSYKENVVSSLLGTIFGIFSGIFCKILGFDWKVKIFIFLVFGFIVEKFAFAVLKKLIKDMDNIEKFRNSFFALYLTSWYAAWVFFLNYPLFQ